MNYTHFNLSELTEIGGEFMKLLNEFPSPLELPLGSKTSCLIRDSNSYIGFDMYKSIAYLLNRDGCLKQFSLQHDLEKLTIFRQKDTYIAASNVCPSHLYFLNDTFREIGSIKICSEQPILEDIWFDTDTNLIWLVTSSNLYRVNVNGDSLGSFLCAPKGTAYRAVCTHGDFFFLAYTSGGGDYIATYTRHGMYLEKISLGSEYNIRNLQVLTDDLGQLCLYAYAIKSYRFPYVVKIELNIMNTFTEQDFTGLSVECVTEASEMCSTCNIIV